MDLGNHSAVSRTANPKIAEKGIFRAMNLPRAASEFSSELSQGTRGMGFPLTALLLLLLCIAPFPGRAEQDVVLEAMQAELERSIQGFRERAETPPYFLGYQITEIRAGAIRASNGALVSSTETRRRFLNVIVRVGDYELDNTHGVRGEPGALALFRRRGFVSVSLDDQADALRAALWRETDRQYRIAVEDLEKVRTSRKIKVEEEGSASDFSREEPGVWSGPRAPYRFDKTRWEGRVRDYSRLFRRYPEILISGVHLSIQAVTKYIVNSEGTRLRFGETRLRLALSASGRAEDGMNLFRYDSFDTVDWRDMPKKKTVRARIAELAEEVGRLRSAPVGDAFSGPAILTGRAAGVFFHEVLGHRVEGHRQRDEFEGQTFTKKLGDKVLPDFISVYDDPTKSELVGVPLMGHYRHDDEGVPAQPVTLVRWGVLENFLMSRQPLEKFGQSNGHGRRQPGGVVTARQGNLIVEARSGLPYRQLRQKLAELARRQDKEYGLLFEDIAGGFTETMRFSPQSFQVQPLMVYRVFADGRPDELVRGLDIVGTPLTVLGKIVGASDRREVFNGICVAESGAIPVSAASPALLISEIEVQKQQKNFDRPPLLPPPPSSASSMWDGQ